MNKKNFNLDEMLFRLFVANCKEKHKLLNISLELERKKEPKLFSTIKKGIDY